MNSETTIKLKDCCQDPFSRSKQPCACSSELWSRHSYSGIDSRTMQGCAGATCRGQRWEGYMNGNANRAAGKHTVGESHNRSAAVTIARGRRSYRQFGNTSRWEDYINNSRAWQIGKQRAAGSQNSSATGTTATGRRSYRQICNSMPNLADFRCATWNCIHHAVQIVSNATNVKLNECYQDQCRRSKQVWSQHKYTGFHSTTMEGGAGASCQDQRWEGNIKFSAAKGGNKQIVGKSQNRSAAVTTATGRRSYRQFCNTSRWEDYKNNTKAWQNGKQRAAGSQNSSATGTTATGRRSYRQISSKVFMLLACSASSLACILNATAVLTSYQSRSKKAGDTTAKARAQNMPQSCPISQIYQMLQDFQCSKARQRLTHALVENSRWPHYLKLALARQSRRRVQRRSGPLLCKAYMLHRVGFVPKCHKAGALPKQGLTRHDPVAHPQPPSDSQSPLDLHSDTPSRPNDTKYVSAQRAPPCTVHGHAIPEPMIARLQAVPGKNTFCQLEYMINHHKQLVSSITSPGNDNTTQATCAWVYCPTYLIENVPRMERRLINSWVDPAFTVHQDQIHEHLYAVLPKATSPPSPRTPAWGWLPADFFVHHFGLEANAHTMYPWQLYTRRLSKRARKHLQPITHMNGSTPGNIEAPSSALNLEQLTQGKRTEPLKAPTDLNEAPTSCLEPTNTSKGIASDPGQGSTTGSSCPTSLLCGGNGTLASSRTNTLRQLYPNVTWFPQVAMFCWLHSHNMMLQNESIKTEHILQSLNHDVSDTRCIGKGILRESFGDIGPFCSTAINRYLYKHASPMVFYKALLSNQQNATGLTHAQFLALLPPGTKGAGVSFTPQGYTCGHMKCIRYIEADQTWYALDSWLGDFITPLLTDSDWKHHTRNASIYALLYADTFPWNHMGVPCPNYLHNSMIEIDNDRPFNLNQSLTIHHNPIRAVNDQYTPPEVAQHTELTVGPIVVNLIPLNDPAQISSAADLMEQDAQ